MKDYDIVIVGGGIVGMLAALAAADTGAKIAIIDANKIEPVPETHKINLVINATSLKILESIGLGDIMSSSLRINKCIISAKGHFGRVRICAKDLKESSLGKTIALDSLRNQLTLKLQQHKNITCLSECKLTKISCTASGLRELHYNDGSIRTKLLLAADGVNSMVRKLSNIETTQEDFDYDAMLFYVNMNCSENIALQRFLSPGSIALIPSREQQACIIWTLPRKKVKARLKLPPEQLMSLAQHDLGKSAGKIRGLVSEVMSYPTHMQRAQKISLPGLVLLGPCANHLLPITAQGLNLAIRDIAVMREVFVESEVWDEDAARRYDILRAEDHNSNYQQIKYLLRFFNSNNTGISILRSLGFASFGASSPFARRIANIGFGNVDYDFVGRMLDI